MRVSLSQGSRTGRYGRGAGLDLLSEGRHIPLSELQVLHRGKTGALFLAAIEIGLILSHASADVHKAI